MPSEAAVAAEVKDKGEWTSDGVWSLKENKEAEPVPTLPHFAHFPFFWFPYVVNEWGARLVGMQVSITCIILGALFLADAGSRRTISFFSAMIFAGYVLRFFFGANYSFFGATGGIVARYLEPSAIGGPQKQFAAACGICFSLAAMLGYFYGPVYVGPIFSFALAGAAGMEGFLGFCVGCWIFQYMLLPLGIVDAKYINMSITIVPDERKKFQDRFVSKKWEAELKEEGKYRPWKYFEGYLKPTTMAGRPLRFKYSDKNEHHREDRVDFVRYCKITYALPGLGWAAVAANFKVLFLRGVLDEQYPWVTFAIIGFVLFALWALLYFLKIVLHPSRFVKDLEGKHSRYYMAAVPIALLLFGFLAQRESDGIAEALFWLGGMSNIFLTVWLLARTFIHPVSSGEVSPAMTIPLLGNILASITLEQWLNWRGIEDLSWFLAAPSFVLWALLAPAILLRIMDAPALAPGMRATVCTYIAAPALAAAAYYSLTKSIDVLFLTLFFFAVFAEILVWMLFLANYFRAKFNEGYWFVVFCFASLTFPLLSFERTRLSDFAYMWLIAQVTLTTGIALILTAHSIANVFHGKWFRNWPKPEGVGALSFFTRLSHDAFRTAGVKIEELWDQATADYGTEEGKKLKKEMMLEMIDGYLNALEIHSDYEDNIIWKHVDMYLPGRRPEAERQHVELHNMIHQIEAIVEQIKNPSAKPATQESKDQPEKKGNNVQVANVAVEMDNLKKEEKDSEGGTNALQKLGPLLQKFFAANNEHMSHEEDHISGIIRKLIPSKEAKSIARKAFRRGTPAQWRKALPFLIQNQDYHMRRIRMLGSLRIAYPERMQLFGAWIYMGVGEALFQRLRVDFPELAPRYTEGYWRMW